jgi:hypothetical protein
MFQGAVFKSIESVSVHDDHFGGHSLTNQVRELLKPLSLEIDTTADLLDDLMIWLSAFQVLHLSLQVFFLLG